MNWATYIAEGAFDRNRKSSAKQAILGLQPRDKAAVLGSKQQNFFSRRIYMKIGFSSQRKEMLMFLSANMATVTSRANQQ